MRGQELCWELNGEWKRMRIEKEGKAADGGRPRRADAHHPILLISSHSHQSINPRHKIPSFALFPIVSNTISSRSRVSQLHFPYPFSNPIEL
jgi:hypothetical protein